MLEIVETKIANNILDEIIDENKEEKRVKI